MRYAIYNEDGELMRKVQSKEEAQHICAKREGWYYKFIRRMPFDLSRFEEAPF